MRYQRGRVVWIDLPGLIGGLNGISLLANIHLRVGAGDQYPIPHCGRQAIGQKPLQQFLVSTQKVVGLDLQDYDFGPIRAQSFRFGQDTLSAKRLTDLEVGLPQQYQRGQHFGVLLKRVLELNDRTRFVMPLMACQRVFVKPRGLGVAISPRQRGCAQAGQQDNHQGIGPPTRLGTSWIGSLC